MENLCQTVRLVMSYYFMKLLRAGQVFSIGWCLILQKLMKLLFTALKTHALQTSALKGKPLEEEDDSCVSGCYRCLLSYYNQMDHELINRRDDELTSFLRNLAESRANASENSVNEDTLRMVCCYRRVEVTSS